jgi:hypothetical protein
MDGRYYARMLADDAVSVFAYEWVEAFSAEIHALPESSRARTDARICFLHAVRQLRETHTYPIPFVQVLRAIAECINRQAGALYEPLCGLFTYFMEGYARPAEYAGFEFRGWNERRGAG